MKKPINLDDSDDDNIEETNSANSDSVLVHSIVRPIISNVLFARYDIHCFRRSTRLNALPVFN